MVEIDSDESFMTSDLLLDRTACLMSGEMDKRKLSYHNDNFAVRFMIRIRANVRFFQTRGRYANRITPVRRIKSVNVLHK